MRDILRRVYFAPYLKGNGPRFALTMWATDRIDQRGQTTIGYRLNMGRQTLFTGEDFNGSPMHADDSDATVKALMGFLTLCPGDTDREYFDTYTPEQMDFCSQYAEILSAEVYARFGE